MKLAGKLIVLFIVVVMAVTAVSSHFASKQFLVNVEQQHEEIARNIREMEKEEAFQRAMNSGDHVYFQQVVRTITPNAIQVRWVWLEQGISVNYRPHADEQINKILENSRVMSMTDENEDGTEDLLTYCPFETNGKTGAVELLSPLDAVNEQSRRIWIIGLMTIGASGLLGIAAVMTAGVRWIARPLNQLTEKMERVGEGDFSSDLKIDSGDELGELATAVNQMCDKLRSQQETIQQKTEQKIKAMEQLRHADRLKTVGQLAAGLAHEVGTPLNVVAGRASMIMADPDMPHDKVCANAETIKTEADRISGIIQKLMDFARRSPLNMIVGDLKEVVTRAAELIGPLARSKNIHLETQLPDQPAMAKFDFNQMQQVIMNLIDNAVDASPAEGTVSVSLSPNDRNWLLRVSDQGPGIQTSDQQNIFEPFFTTKDVGAGTGLGLSIAHGIVEEHGGRIRFESADEGTTFVVELPRKKEQV